MRDAEPDVFIHCGDTIYADGVVQPQVKLDDGSMWTNIVTEAKSKVAQTLDDYRGCYKYNLLDEHMRRFNAGVAQIAHLGRPRGARQLVRRARSQRRRALPGQEHGAALGARAAGVPRVQPGCAVTPTTRSGSIAPSRYGPLLEIFALDLRSYRGANSANRQASLSPESAHLRRRRSSRRFKARLASSRATWKVIASDLPIGLIVGDGADRFEAFANGDAGPPLGRELEIADLLRFIRDRRIRNVVWITGDVHYCAAHHYHPIAREVHRVRSVLGVRRRPAARRHVRPEHARSDVRARGEVQRRAARD